MAIKRVFALLLALSVTAIAQADTLLIEGIEANSQSATARPTAGMSMERVETIYGEPSLKVAAVGDPPIARWEYPGFIVYFERNLVIHAAVRR